MKEKEPVPASKEVSGFEALFKVAKIYQKQVSTYVLVKFYYMVLHYFIFLLFGGFNLFIITGIVSFI